MPQMRIIARLKNDSGLPADDAINVWHFDTDQTLAEDADDTVDRLHVFYQAWQLWSSSNLTGAIHYTVYDMGQPEPRVPVYTDTTKTIVPGGGALPNELAVCLSFRAAPIPGVNPQRLRGRVYLGPLGTGAAVDQDGDVRVASDLVTAVANAAAALAHGPDPGDARLAVYSPTIDLTGSTADAFNDVVSGWVDNAFDIQRRRGSKASARTNWVPA